MRICHVLCLIVVLSGCQAVPTQQGDWMDEWTAFIQEFDRMDSTQASLARELALGQYNNAPDDQARMRLAYTLSRPDVPLRQLDRSREILAEMSDSSPYAPMRDLLDREIRALAELQRARGQTLELEARLEALKAIERDLHDSRNPGDQRP